MDYELAKRLKDAGFPQYPSLDRVSREQIERPYTPILEELIEACGQKNFGLCRNNTRKTSVAWSAFDHAIYEFAENFGDGSTSTEAVANLWLALHEK